jgi:hypothetical protein
MLFASNTINNIDLAQSQESSTVLGSGSGCCARWRLANVLTRIVPVSRSGRVSKFAFCTILNF